MFVKCFLCLTLALPLWLSGCVGPGAVVGFSTVAGDGDARADGNVLVAMGHLSGEAGVFVKGSGFPLTLPLDLKENEWLAFNRQTNETVRGHIGVDALPAWCLDLYRPGELDLLVGRLSAVPAPKS